MSDQYDEFGNFLGDLSDEEEAGEDGDAQPYASTSGQLPGYDDDEEDGAVREDGDVDMEDDEEPERPSNAVILLEDKKYYPSASEVYGDDVEAMVQEEDLQPLSEPIIAPVKTRAFRVEEKDMPQTTYDKKCVKLPPCLAKAKCTGGIITDRLQQNPASCLTFPAYRNR
jgi:U5 small nuclear ribonucleoprotein component